LTNHLNDPLQRPQVEGQTEGESKMQLLHSQHQWELMRDHQAEMLKEAQMAHLARMAEKPQQSWWRSTRRQSQSPALTLETSVAPELG
jgi:hypothetical protein